MPRRRTLREIARNHQQNHAMLLMVLRAVKMPVVAEELAQLDGQLVEIDQLVQDVTTAIRAQALAIRNEREERDERIAERRLGDRRAHASSGGS